MRPEDVPPGQTVIKDRDGKFYYPENFSLRVGTTIKGPMGNAWIVETERTEATVKIGWWTGKKWKEQELPRTLVEAWEKSPVP